MTEEHNAREDSVTLHRMAAQLDYFHNDISDMKAVVQELTKAVVKLALIEERQTHASQALERAFSEIEKCHERISKYDARIDALEREQPLQQQTSQWVLATVGGIAAGAAMFIAKQLGITF